MPERSFDDLAADPFCERVGVELVSAEPGAAEATLELEDEHLNFHGTPHGGALYTLADAVFAAACNAGDEDAVALETSMSYLEACDVGDTLTATGERKHDRGRTALYTIEITTDPSAEPGHTTDEDDDLVAEFRGRAYKVG